MMDHARYIPLIGPNNWPQKGQRVSYLYGPGIPE